MHILKTACEHVAIYTTISGRTVTILGFILRYGGLTVFTFTLIRLQLALVRLVW